MVQELVFSKLKEKYQIEAKLVQDSVLGKRSWSEALANQSTEELIAGIKASKEENRKRLKVFHD